MAKDPSDRHGNLAEFAAELAEIESEGRARSGLSGSAPLRAASKKGLGARPGVLVLPFLQLSTAVEDYVASGLTDEIITSLSGLAALRVISHTSAVHLKGTAKSAFELGKELGVKYVLEGSVQRAGDAIRVATRLISTETEELVWGQSYEGVLQGLFDLEKTISRAVVDAMAVQISASERKRLNEHRITDTRAVEYYLRAKQEIYTFTGPALDPMKSDAPVKAVPRCHLFCFDRRFHPCARGAFEKELKLLAIVPKLGPASGRQLLGSQ